MYVYMGTSVTLKKLVYPTSYQKSMSALNHCRELSLVLATQNVGNIHAKAHTYCTPGASARHSKSP